MSMTSLKMKRMIDERLKDLDIRTSFNRDNDTMRIELKETKEGVNIRLPNVIAKYNQDGEAAVDELEEYLRRSLDMMSKTQTLEGREQSIYPVVRATSFPTETKAGKKLVTKDHTAETRIFYALDLGKSYQLIDESMLEEQNLTNKQLDEMAMFNLRSLSYEYKTDEVADNQFHFIATQDGFDASRILNETFLQDMLQQAEGDLAVATPHQDVLIFADIKNDAGYDILAQMTMQFFTEGRIPITSLPFIYDGDKLEPIFILAQNRPKKDE
ncbi:MAG TPA: DUF1444 domain-containing protein [Bacillota bacterium]|nr:DUF1444 domain-containing protein [Bacillota bacterium]